MLIALLVTEATAQTLTSDLLRGEPDGFSGENRPLRRIDVDGAGTGAQAGDGLAPVVSGASSTGFDSLNRKKPKRKPGVPPPAVTPLMPAPPLPSASANRPRVAPSIGGTVEGQPYRRRLKVDEDPFGAVGFYRGSMLVKPAVELWGGYDTNPGRIKNGPPSWVYMVAPELLIASDWQRHALIVDLRGSFTGYSLKNETAAGAPIASELPVDIDRPSFTGKVNGRVDVSRDTRIDTETRLSIGTDNPGSPNIQANLKRLPLYATVGSTLGGVHSYNRLEITGIGTIDRTVYQESTLSDGSRSTNSDRNFNQYGGSLRAAYEIMPHLKPFGEVTVDLRERDLEFDRNGFARTSRGRTARVGSTFELGRLITGEASIGYTTRTYEDPRLRAANGLLGWASLIWTPTALTRVTVTAQSSVDETTLPGVSGVLSRTFNAQVEHAFRRYLIATLKASLTTADYDGSDRSDTIYSVGGELVYKLTRDVHLKAQLRHDWQTSSIPDDDYRTTIFMLGVRLQR